MEMSELKGDVVYGNVSTNNKKIHKQSDDTGTTKQSDPDVAQPVYGNMEELKEQKEAAVTEGELYIALHYLIIILCHYNLRVCWLGVPSLEFA